jgi:AcrR family transcriptional regulator
VLGNLKRSDVLKAEHSRRWIETERRMEQVTLDLMQHADLEHITVRAICEKAKVNRTTFYEHFLDVYDLFDKLELEMRKKILNRYAISDYKAFSVQSFIPFFTHIKENRKFYSIVLKTRTSFPLKQGYEHLLNDVIRPLCLKAGITDEQEILYYLVFFQAGFTITLRRWVETGCRESEEELADIISNCIPDLFTKPD